MDAHYTSLHLLPIIYRELPPDQLDPLFKALQLDERLRAEFHKLKAAKLALPALSIEPAQKTIDSILAYSRAVAS